MFLDSDTVLHEALSEMAPDAFASLHRSYRREMELVAFDVIEEQRQRRQQEKADRRRDIAHKQAAKLQERWDHQIAILRRIQADARALSERFPEFVAFTDQPEPEPVAAPDTTTVAEVMAEAWDEFPTAADTQPEPETVQMHKLTLAQRMARAGRSLAARRRYAA